MGDLIGPIGRHDGQEDPHDEEVQGVGARHAMRENGEADLLVLVLRVFDQGRLAFDLSECSPSSTGPTQGRIRQNTAELQGRCGADRFARRANTIE